MKLIVVLLLTVLHSLTVLSEEMTFEDTTPDGITSEDWFYLNILVSMNLSSFAGRETVNIYFDFWFEDCDEADEFLTTLKAYEGESWRNKIGGIAPYNCKVIREVRMTNDKRTVALEQLKMFEISSTVNTKAEYLMVGP